MDSSSISKSFFGSLNDIISEKDKCTFLVGAGISMDSPSNLPSAREIIRILMEKFTPQEEVEKILKLDLLRYELVVEILQQLWDQELIFMDYFDSIEEPNLIHLFLGQAILNHHYVVTTNFDYLIELALDRLLFRDNKHQSSLIFPVITKADFINHKDPQAIFKDGKYPLYKIHGSKTNIVTKENTIDSLVTTISDLGKDREEGETFAIEGYKKPAVNKLMSERSLIVMGYSGSDDFDIGPVLKELPNLSKLVWIEHTFTDTPEIIEVLSVQELDELKLISKPLNFLCEIRSQTDYPVYLIKANTGKLIESEMWNLIFPNQEIIHPKPEHLITPPLTFRDWATNHYFQTKEIDKYHLANRIYFDLNQFPDVIRTGEKGLSLCDQIEGEDAEWMKSSFYNLLGITYKDVGDWDKASETYQKMLEIEEKFENFNGISSALSGIGNVYYTNKQTEKAIEIFEQCLDIAKTHNFRLKEANYLMNIAMAKVDQGKYNEALDMLEEALKISEEEGNLSNKAILYSNIGRIYKIQLNYDEALENYQQAQRINSELGQIRAVGTRYNLIGQVLYMQDKFDEAYENYKKAVEIYTEINDIDNNSRTKGNIALIHLQKKEYAQALNLYKELIQLAKRMKNYEAVSIRLNNVGTVYQAQEDHSTALKYFNQAIEIDRKRNFKDNLITVLNNIGLSYYELEKYHESKLAFEEGLELSEEIGHYELRSIIHPNIRDLYEKIAEQNFNDQKYTDAVDYYQKSLVIAQERNHLENQAYYLNNIGNSYYYADDYENAYDYFQKALKVAEKAGAVKKISDNYFYLGLVREDEQKYDEALEFFQNSFDFAQKINLESDYPILLKHIASNAENLGDMEKAAESYRQSYLYSLNNCDNLEDAGSIANDFTNLAQYYFDLDQIEKAISQIEKAFEISTSYNFGGKSAEYALAVGFQWESRGNDMSKALQFYEKGEKIALENQEFELWDRLRHQQIKYFRKNKEYEKSIEYLQTNIKVLNENNMNKRLAHRYHDLGKIYQGQNRKEEAITQYQNALKLFQEIGEQKNVEFLQQKLSKLSS